MTKNSIESFINDLKSIANLKENIKKSMIEYGTNRAILVFGPTGVGKSTFINYLAGKELIVEKLQENGKIVLDLKEQSNNTIGHSQTSATSNIIVSNNRLLADNSLSFDTPGLQDTRRSKYTELFNAALFKSITEIEELKQLKIILMIPEAAILGEVARGGPLQTLLDLFEQLICCINGEIFDSIGLIVAQGTRSPEQITGILRDNVIDGEAAKDFHPNIKRFIKTILDEGKIATFNKPSYEEIGSQFSFDDKIIKKLVSKLEYIDNSQGLFNYAITPNLLVNVANEIAIYNEDFVSNLHHEYFKTFNVISENKIIKGNYVAHLSKYYEENEKIIDVLNSIQQVEKANITSINSHNIPNVIKNIQVTSPFPEIQESIDRANYFITKVKGYYSALDIIFSMIGDKVSLRHPDHQKIASKLYDALKLNKVLIDWSIVRHLLKEHFESQVEKYGYKFYKGDEYTDGIRNKMLSPGEYLLNLLNQIKTNFVADMSESELEDMMSDISTIVHLNKKKISSLISDQDFDFLKVIIAKSAPIQEDFTNILRNAYEPQLECKQEAQNTCLCESNIITTYEIVKDKQKKIDIYGCKIINVVAREMIVINYDLKLPGETLNWSAPKLVTVQHGKEEYRLDLKGTDGENYTMSAPDGEIGCTGVDGATGKKGQNGGTFIGNFTKIILNSYLTIDTSGGNGGNGQSSGNGGIGRIGEKSNITSITKKDWLAIKENKENCIKDTKICIIKEEVVNDPYFFNIFSCEQTRYTLSFPGSAGQKGLNPGKVGIKGNGGMPGKIEIYKDGGDYQEKRFLEIINKKGNDGLDGNIGKVGDNGEKASTVYKNVTVSSEWLFFCLNDDHLKLENIGQIFSHDEF